MISLGVTALYFAALYLSGQMNLYYDSAMMRSIVNGDMLGTPDPHLMFSNYLFGWVLSVLYRVLPALNWYSLMLLFAIYFSLWAVLYRVLTLEKHPSVMRQMLSAGIMVFLFNFFFYDSIMGIYFHNCALIAGVCAFLYFLLSDELSWADVVIIGMLGVLCAGIRFSVFREMAPFFILAAAIRFFVFRKRKRLFWLIGGLVVIVGAMYLVNTVAYRGEYAEARAINTYRGGLQDYNGLPEYAGHEELYAGVGMTEEDVDIMRVCWGLSEHLKPETMSVLLKASQAEHSGQEEKQEQVSTLIQGLFEKDYGHGFWFLLALSVLGALLVVFRKREWGMLGLYGLLILIVAGEILYLAYNGRMPVRVTQGPLLMILLTGIGYMLLNREMIAERISEKMPARVACILLALCCAYSVYVDSEQKYFSFQDLYIRTERELQLGECIMRDAENVYFVHGLHDSLDVILPRKRNFTGWGGWISETVDWRKMLLGEYDNVWEAIASRRELRFIMTKDFIGTIQNYMNHHGYAVEAVSESVVINDKGVSYDVWRFVPAET